MSGPAWAPGYRHRTADVAPISFRFKASPEDFVVHELAAEAPTGEGEHLWLGLNPSDEVLHRSLRVGVELNEDHRLEGDPERLGIDIGAEAEDSPVCPQTSHPLQAARWRKTDLGGQLFVGLPCIILQRRQDVTINSVKGSFFHWIPNSNR